jgi:F-type H+-transporting ATPase subunit delta
MAVAQRMYAGALYEAARDQDRVDVVHDQLAELAAAMETSPELEAFLANPQLDPGAKASVLEEVTSGADPIVRNFVRLVASKGKAGQLRAIAEEFEAIVDREQGRLNVELTTAYELDDEEEKAIVAKIEQASGRTVEATRSVDPDLIGGMILQAGSFRVDASVRGRLDRLRRERQGGGTHGSPTGPLLPRRA